MKKTIAPVVQAPAVQEELPARVQEALGELAAVAREGLLALSVGVGLRVLAELMEEEVVEVVGAKGKHDPERVAVRHGHEAGEVTLGGRRVAVERPRVRSADGSSELPLATYRHFADRDSLTRVVLERMLAGVSTRRYRRTQEPVGEEVEQRADDVRLALLMLDGIELKGRTNIVALGITTEGVKIPLGLWEGSTENATVATALLSDLVERGLDPEQGILFVIDGSKALRKAIRTVFGERAPVQRCVRHKERNVLEHLPERDRALNRLQALGAELERSHPGAAASLREAIAETLTLARLGISGSLRRTLASTNPCESMIECVRRTSRNVKRWSSGEMGLRWTAAGMLEAERQFRRIIGYRDLAKLAIAIQRDAAIAESSPRQGRRARLVTPRQGVGSPPSFRLTRRKARALLAR